MKHEKKTLVMIYNERSCENNPEIVNDTVENTAYELYKNFINHRITGEEIYTFEVTGNIPETIEEKRILETTTEEGKAIALKEVSSTFNGKPAKSHTIYFKADYDDGEGPECFASKYIEVVKNGKQVYISYNGSIPYPKLGTVAVNVTINEINYCLSIPVKFDEFDTPWKTDNFGVVVDKNGNTFDLHNDSVPGIPDALWMDIIEEVVPN